MKTNYYCGLQPNAVFQFITCPTLFELENLLFATCHVQSLHTHWLCLLLRRGMNTTMSWWPKIRLFDFEFRWISQNSNILSPQLRTDITSLYELHFQRSLYPQNHLRVIYYFFLSNSYSFSHINTYYENRCNKFYPP